jgi:hypothetical protein
MEIWIQFGITLITTAGLFLWVRTESRNDFRKSEEESKQIRRDLVDVMRESKEDWKQFNEKWAQESRQFREIWAQESKDFHGRLCSIEERRIKEK